MAFECVNYYRDDGTPGADADPPPAPNTPKRDVTPATKIARDNTDAAVHSGPLFSRQEPDDVGSSDPLIAMSSGDEYQKPPTMPLREQYQKTPPKRYRGDPPPLWVCTSQYLESLGLGPKPKDTPSPDESTPMPPPK